MRGKGPDSAGQRYNGRITPAYAGKRNNFSSIFRCSRDHPRLCGEKTAGVPITSSVSGSPPPMRGKGDGRYRRENFWGITPAYAGKRTPSFVLLLHFRDHPRLCGEKSMLSPKLSLYTGSPPPMRGKASVFREWKSGKGITPAYAGKRRVAGKKHDLY